MAVLWLPMLNSVGKFWEFERKSENRIFRDTLHIYFSNLGVFPIEAEEFVNDNFSFRAPLLEAYNYEKFYVFNISPHPEKTIIGSDGWFFMSQKELDIYEGRKEFTDEQLAKFDSVWTNRKHYLDSSDIVSYWMICPMKQNVYPEKMPFNTRKKPGKTRVQILEDYLAEGFPNFIIDPTNAFLKAKDSMQLFYKLDNHWNRQAGLIATDLIIQRLQSDFSEIISPKFTNFNWVDTIYATGYHRDVVGIKSLREQDYFPVPNNEKATPSEVYNFPVTEGFPYPNDFEKVFRNPSDTTAPKILIIRDSFGDQLIPFLKEPFSESVFIFDGWNYGLNKEIIEEIKPDIVIFLGLETHLEHFIER